MSYRISYLMPKKEFKCLIGKKQSQAVQEAPAKKSSTPRRKAKPKKASPHPEGTQNRRQQKSGKGLKRPNPPTEKKLGGSE